MTDKPAAPQPEERLFDLVADTHDKLKPYLKIEVFDTGTRGAGDLAIDVILQAALEQAAAPPLAAFRALAEKWDAGVLELKVGVADSPSHDLKRMIKERAEAFDICIAELRALIAQEEGSNRAAELRAGEGHQ